MCNVGFFIIGIFNTLDIEKFDMTWLPDPVHGVAETTLATLS